MTITNRNQYEDGAEVLCPHGLSSQRSSFNPGCVAAPLSTKKRRENKLTLYQDTDLERRKFKGNVLHNNTKPKTFSVGSDTGWLQYMLKITSHAGFPRSPIDTPIFTPAHPISVTEHSSFQRPLLGCTTQHNLQDTKVMGKEGLERRAVTGC